MSEGADTGTSPDTGTGTSTSNAETTKVIDVDVAKVLLNPMNHALALWARECFKLGVPGHSMIELYLNHMASVVAQIEPAGSREETVKQLVSTFPAMVSQHFAARNTTPGGIILPRAMQ